MWPGGLWAWGTEMTKESGERRESPKSFTQRRMWKPMFECRRGEKCEA